MHKQRTLVVLGLVTALALTALAYAAADRCSVCGFEVGAARVVVTYQNGKERTFACPRCAFGSLLPNEVKSMQATDFFSRKAIDAKSAFYLKNTGVGACCEPYWIAFASRTNAEKFSRGFGGRVLTYEEAINDPDLHPHKN